MRYTIIFPTIVLGLLLANIVWAQIEIPNPLKANTFEDLVKGIITFLLQLALAVAPIMIVIAGFLFVSGGGEPKQVQRAKDILLYTVIGLFVILISWGLITVIEDLFAKPSP